MAARTINGRECDKEGRPLECQICGKPLVFQSEAGGFDNVSIGKFSSMSREDKKKSLKRRSKAHARTAYNRDKKTHMDTNHLTK
ncbi:hypothetical protein EOM86_05175 [Candidatus Nomurabacteria bacterium]|nr:hypothetical protein [Candidatus Nomurabacteria bacterium]